MAIVAWLKQCELETVAMESTGVYWIPVFQVLETHGFEVLLVNAHPVKSVPGRKSDVLDYQWLRQLSTPEGRGPAPASIESKQPPLSARRATQLVVKTAPAALCRR